MPRYSIITTSGVGYNFTVHEPFTYKDITVPKGFTSNGANIPRSFWSIVPPNYMQILPAIAVHDYLCRESEFEKANQYFKELLIEQNVRPYKQKVLNSGVVIYSKYIRPTLKRFNLYKQDK